MNKRIKERTKQIFLMAILLTWTVLVVYPFIWLASNSLKTDRDIILNTFALPLHPEWMNYVKVLRFHEIFQFFGNTVFVTAVSLFFLVWFATMAAFAIARVQFRGNKTIFVLFTAGILLPGNIALIPLFVLFVKFHMLNNIFTLPIPYVATALTDTVFILVGFLRSLPSELEEAAKIDGCNLWRIYTNVSLPLSLPGIMTIVIFKGISFWNSFLLPLLLASSEKSRTLSIGIRMFVGKESSDIGLSYAALMISVLPTVIFYFALHDKILKGLVIGAIKG